tara:strand:- start:479 stop:661 length:183 start_codon:yes stop_codon:yes gene_type:complete
MGGLVENNQKHHMKQFDLWSIVLGDAKALKKATQLDSLCEAWLATHKRISKQHTIVVVSE